MLSYDSVAPFLAPLSKSMMLQALATQEKEKELSLPSFATDLNEQLHLTAQDFTRRWLHLIPRVQEKRDQVYDRMKPVMKDNRLTSRWMLDTLTEFRQLKNPDSATPLSKETLSRWRSEGLVRYQTKNQPDSDSGAGVLTLSLLVPKANGWMPSPPKEEPTLFLQEPMWWCWRQDTPSSPVIPCPVPLPTDVPSHALLWTSWLGAEWKPSWLRIGSLGCCRWGGTIMIDGTLMWAMKEQDLEMWGTPITKQYHKALDNDAPLTRHTVANSALLALAIPLLEEMQHPMLRIA